MDPLHTHQNQIKAYTFFSPMPLATKLQKIRTPTNSKRPQVSPTPNLPNFIELVVRSNYRARQWSLEVSQPPRRDLLRGADAVRDVPASDGTPKGLGAMQKLEMSPEVVAGTGEMHLRLSSLIIYYHGSRFGLTASIKNLIEVRALG